MASSSDNIKKMMAEAEEPGMFSNIGKISGQVWDAMPWYDKLALITSPVPVLGTATGVAADSYTLYKEPSALNVGMLGTNFIPGARIARALAKTAKQGTGLFTKEGRKLAGRTLQQPAKEGINKMLHEFPNFLPGFYGGGPAGKVFGAGVAGATALKNMTKSSFSPKDQGLWKQFGVSRTDVDVAKRYSEMLEGNYNPNIIRKGLDEAEAWVMGKSEAFKKIPVEGIDKKDLPTDFNPFRYEKANVSKDAQKKIMGQINQSRLFNEQYAIQSDFYKVLNGMDQIDYANLGAKQYDALMEGATGLSKTDLGEVFKHIGMKGIQNVDPTQTYRMALRRPNTAASGNLERVLSGNPKVFGGSNLKGLQQVFGAKKVKGEKGFNFSNAKAFKTDKEFLKALKDSGVRVRNPEEVLKGRPAIVTGSLTSDAYELGGVNYMTAIKKDGRLTSFMNDENDVFKFKAPLADRLISVSTPIVYDLLGKGRKSGTKASKETLKEGSAKVRAEVEQVMGNMPGVDTSLRVPSTNTTKAQWFTIQALRNLKLTDPKAIAAGRGAVAERVARTSTLGAKPLIRSNEEQ
jgi:hypothetical protein|tara:strand:+ start:2992 stop:4716 length:1725 start_codon:yes stop_codon:yes gene_type:complete